MLYQLLRSLLFQLDAETSHHLGMSGIKWAHKLKLSSLIYPPTPATPVEVMGLTFPNRVGMAAGLDKNGDYLPALSALGFGFVEMPKSGEAKVAIKNLNNKTVGSNKIRVKKAEDKNL